MKHDIEMFDKKIERLNERISEFAKLPPGFGPIVHKPGFTSVADWVFLNGGIDNLRRQIETATEFWKRLRGGAEKVPIRLSFYTHLPIEEGNEELLVPLAARPGRL